MNLRIIMFLLKLFRNEIIYKRQDYFNDLFFWVILSNLDMHTSKVGPLFFSAP